MGNVYPVAPGMISIGASGYIPTMYSAKVLADLFEQTCLPEISSNDYENDIKQMGDSVIIRSDPTITITDDVADGATLNFETPSVDSQTLSIDKSQAWAFKTGKVQMKQTDIKNYTARWMAAATKYLKIRLETRVFAYMVTATHASNAGASSGVISGDIELGTASGTSVTVSKTDVVERLADMKQVLDEQNVPQEDRWVIVPPWFVNRTMISDVNDAAKMGDSASIVRNGRLGSLCGFTIYQSNLLPTAADSAAATCTYIPFGHKMALTFAAQITSNENVPDPYSVGATLWKGLFVYGRRVVKPEAMGVMFAKKA